MEFSNYVVPSVSSTLDQGHIKAESLLNRIKNHDGSEAYHSLFDMEARPDFKSYQGVARPASGFFAFDFDSLDLYEARRDALKLIKELNIKHPWVFFSGSKGFHVYVAANFFGVPENRDTVRAYQGIVSELKTRLKLATLDDGIVQANRKFRLPGSRHPKTGLYKTELHWEIFVQDIDAIKEFSKTRQPLTFELIPEPNLYAGHPPSTKPQSDLQTGAAPSAAGQAGELGVFGVDNVLLEDAQTGEAFSKFDDKKCVKEMWEGKFQEGERHAVATILISDSFYTGLPKDEAYSKMLSWAEKQGVAERFERDFVRLIEEQYSGVRAYSFGCYHNLKKKLCKFEACGLYKMLDPSKRAQDPEKPAEVIAQEVAKYAEKKAEKSEKAAQKAARDDKIQAARAQNFVQGFPDWGQKTPKGTLANVRHLLQALNITARYDVIKKDLQISIPEQDFIIDTAKNDKLNTIISLAVKADLPYSHVPAFVGTIASSNPYNPVLEWLNSRPWDGTSRLKEFFSTVTAMNEATDPKILWLKETLLKRWMVSAVAGAVLPNGVSAGGVLVFTGKQYIGKTNWFKNLVPKELGVLKDGQLLDPKDKDSVYQSVSNWLVELGELDATFKKADIAQLKAFITKDQDTMRLPYQREPATFARRTVFFGSVNDVAYLNDPTGNRRFWTINCEAINHTHGMDMQQVWAEVHELFKKNEPWFLSREEMEALNYYNEAHTVVDPMEHMIAEKFDLNANSRTSVFHCYNATEIARTLGFERPGRKDTLAVSTALRKLGVPEGTNQKGRGFLLCPLQSTENLMKVNAKGLGASLMGEQKPDNF